MLINLTLEYWKDGHWYVGRLKEVPGVFSQGENIQDLEESIRDAYNLMLQDVEATPMGDIRTKQIGIEV